MAKKREYRTMRGRVVDMDLLQKKHELTPAVGNAKMNARGDEIGPGGKIVRKREDIVREHYGNMSGTVADESGRFNTASAKNDPQTDLSAEELEMFEEAAEEDEWIEDEDGNFVQKGE
jgi:hypothetical protein